MNWNSVAKILIGFVSMNVILNYKYIGGLIWAVHWQKNTPYLSCDL